MKSNEHYYFNEIFPELDPLDLRVKQGNKEIKLMTYRYPPSANFKESKGIIFYLHAYGTYGEKCAFFFKNLAHSGYDCFALDLRGFGHSGGERGFMES